MRDMLLLIGRILLVAIFISSGLTKFFDLGGTAGYIASKGLPLSFILAPIVAVAEVGLGVLIAAGFRTRLAAYALAAFSLLTILFFHDFWNMTGTDRMMNQIQAMKNVAMIGAFLIVAAVGPGRLSVDRA